MPGMHAGATDYPGMQMEVHARPDASACKETGRGRWRWRELVEKEVGSIVDKQNITCVRCSSEFMPFRRGMKFCSDKCRQKHLNGRPLVPGGPRLMPGYKRYVPFSLPRLLSLAVRPESPDEWLKAICNYVAETERPVL